MKKAHIRDVHQLARELPRDSQMAFVNLMLPLSPLSRLLIEVFLHEKTIPDSVFQRATKDGLTLIAQNLSRSERLILILVQYEEMTYREIGIVLDLSAEKVSSIYADMLGKLAKSLRAFGIK